MTTLELNFTSLTSADGTTVSTFSDISGNSRNVTAVNGTGTVTVTSHADGTKGINLGGTNGFRFTTAGTGVSDALNTAWKANFTAHYVIEPNNAADTHYTLFDKSLADSGAAAFWPGLTPNSGSANYVPFSIFQTSNSPYCGDFRLNTKQVLSFTRTSGGVVKVYRNGVLIGQGTHATAWSDSAVTAFFISSVSTSYGFKGKAYYLKVLDTVQTDSEVFTEAAKLGCYCKVPGFIKTEDDIRFVILGNSLTTQSTTAINFNLTENVRIKLSTLFGRNIDIVNIGVSGATWATVLSAQITGQSFLQKMFVAGRTYFIYLLEYTNSIAGGQTAAQAFAAQQAAITAIRAAATAAGATVKIVVATAMKSSSGTGSIYDAAAVLQRAEGTGNSGSLPNALLDLNANTLLDYTITPGNFASDLIHLNNLGQEIHANLLAQTFQTMMPQTTTVPSAASVASAVRTELTTELARIDENVSAAKTVGAVNSGAIQAADFSADFWTTIASTIKAMPIIQRIAALLAGYGATESKTTTTVTQVFTKEAGGTVTKTTTKASGNSATVVVTEE